MPFEELPHTADWALRVWAPDLAGLFAEAARGMNALTGAEPVPGPAAARAFESAAADPEGLLVAFLSELVYAAEHERLLFGSFQVQLSDGQGGWRLRVEMEAYPLGAVSKAIKAVTYHGLRIHESVRGWEVEIVFDV